MTSVSEMGVLRLRRLYAGDREQVVRHLLALERSDREARFGAVVGDDIVRAFVAGLDFTTERLLALETSLGGVLALAQVSPISGDSAEFAVSVASVWRRHGMASVLFVAAHDEACCLGISTFVCVHGHPAILRIAARLGLSARLRWQAPRVVIELGARVVGWPLQADTNTIQAEYTIGVHEHKRFSFAPEAGKRLRTGADRR